MWTSVIEDEGDERAENDEMDMCYERENMCEPQTSHHADHKQLRNGVCGRA